jgi:hypothetical protein
MDIFSSRNPMQSERASEIKKQVVAELGLAEDATVMVTELTCSEEGCPPIETVIAVFQSAKPKIQFKMHRSLADITAHDIHEICAQQTNAISEKNHGSCRS